MQDSPWLPGDEPPQDSPTVHANDLDATPPAQPVVGPEDWGRAGGPATDQPTVHAEDGLPPTYPPGQQPWFPQDATPGEQPTVQAGEHPVIPGHGQQPGQFPPRPPAGQSTPGFVRTVPADTPTPEPYQRPPAPFGPPRQQPPAMADHATKMIGAAPQVRGELAWLAILDAADPSFVGKIFTLQPDQTSIGRHRSNHVVLPDESCSALHARIRVEPGPEDGEAVFVLYDVGSTNGTFVGDRKTYRDAASRRYRHPLADGDFVLIGETTLVFKKV